MIATQGSTARDIFARAVETARGKLRETIEKHPDTLPADTWSDRGAFPGMLWIMANLLSAEQDPEAAWWREQATRYSNLLAALPDDPDPAGLGAVFLPELAPAIGDAIVHAGQRLCAHLSAVEPSPSIESLLDAILVFQAAAISGESNFRDVAAAHCLAVRRLVVRGDGSVSGDLARAIYGFAAAYRFTRDPRFLGTAENCAAYLLENLSDTPRDPIAASALLQLSALAADPAKSRFYSLCARQLLIPVVPDESLWSGHYRIEDYCALDAASRLSHAAGRPAALANLVASAPLPATYRNGASHTVAVEAPVADQPAAPEPSESPSGEPELESGRKHVHPVTFLLAPFIFYLLLDLIVFRSNFYLRYIEPESSAGTFEAVFEHETTRQRHANEIIVMGSSRIAEGFSAKRVNQGASKNDYWFVNGAVSGAGARCQYYLVRDMDPKRDRYKAIVMTIDDYTDQDDYEDLADRVEDLYTSVGRLRFTDIRSFMRSFTTHPAKMEVLKGGLLKTWVHQRDLQEFMDHPSERLDKVALFRGHRFDWAYDYFGNDHALTGATIDWATTTITFPPNIARPEQDYLRPRMIITAPQKGRVRSYQVRWLGALADLYRNSATRIIFIQAPRTPFPRPVPLAHLDWTTVDDLAKRPWVTVVDRHAFESFEKPELFSDHAHLNTEGQKQFSPVLAATVKEILRK